MTSKTSNLYITIVEKSGAFKVLSDRFRKKNTKYDFEGLSALRKIISNEKARILHFIKHKKPGSIYELSKMLGRDFKSVNQDIKLLKRFEFVDLISERTGNRKRLKPVIALETINFRIKI